MPRAAKNKKVTVKKVRTNIKLRDPREIPADIKKQRKFAVIIHSQEGELGKADVPIGINGNVYLVKRGYEVVLPESYVQNLKDAKITQIGKNDDGTEDIREISRFSYEILGEVEEVVEVVEDPEQAGPKEEESGENDA